jgi:hypothetical protein
MEGWLGAAFEPGLRFDIDVDKLDALAEDRAREWTRIGAADFLSRDEKREATGYGDKGRLGGKGYNADQPRAPAGTPEGGQWTSGEGGGERTQVAQTSEAFGLIDLTEHEAPRGSGHTIERHVGKSDAFLIRRVETERYPGVFVSVGLEAAGTFPSLEAANKLVSATIAENASQVQEIINKSGGKAVLQSYFSAPTGREAYKPGPNAQPSIRPTYGVLVVVRPDSRTSRGYSIVTAMPNNPRRR